LFLIYAVKDLKYDVIDVLKSEISSVNVLRIIYRTNNIDTPYVEISNELNRKLKDLSFKL
jgi:hypothetical protein